jgi:site-specific recombinase
MSMSHGNPGLLLRLGRLVRGPERLALDYLLASANPSAPLADRVVWLTELLRWVRLHQPPKAAKDERGDAPQADGESPGRRARDRALRIRVARVRFLLRLLDRHPEWKAPLAQTVRSVLRDTRALSLFATTGLPREYGFWGELIRRLTGKLLPEARVFYELADVFAVVFPGVGDEQIPAALPSEANSELGALFRHGEAPDESCWRMLQRDLLDAIIVLAAQVAAIGVSESVRRRAHDVVLGNSPFLALGAAAQAYVAATLPTGDPTRFTEARIFLAAQIDGCRQALTEVTAHLEQHGVSVSLVYRIELARQQLKRIERLVALSSPDAIALGEIGRFIAELIHDMQAQRSVRALVGSNLDLLTRKIAERTGKTGEHYITRDRAEYADMLRSASSGGAVTGFTVLIKFAVTGHGLPLFVEGFAASLNYAISFCAIQVFHGTLATKQPAMTAATMAAKLKQARRRGRLREFVDEVANLTRSQVAAIAGNLIAVIPAALIVGFAWSFSGGEPLPSPEKAKATIESFDLIGPTPFFAAFTGVLLWFSAILSGWVENWAVYRRLPDAIAHHPRLVYAFGEDRMQRAAAWFERNIAGLGGNIALGILLGMTPVIASFFGLPIEVRHVTLSTGSLALSVEALGPEVLATGAFWMACAGIAVVGFMNLTVSFALALWVAIRATGAGALSRRRVFRAVMARLIAAPRDFLLPPREPRVAIA